ncbi:hypothetical protein [Sandaracinus amylolyticus]|uniref:hypothetical protein n=2 Tax=Sandaracinus TaxID=1055688 RepID=UPI001F329053|nr:hypothetical protein [Sandaracinus amylolyticus]UJR87285.1 Hypothetical protein I5071_770 [Sandaracinus amylolyticus]
MRDASVSRDAALDADVVDEDSSVGCGPDEHECNGVCREDGENDPATGCRLGCGAPCPGGTDAICEPDGTCGLTACTPMTCEEQDAICGLVDDGCGRRRSCGTCDATQGERCVSGMCVCEGDSNEPNDSPSAAPALGAVDDSDDPPAMTIEGTIHTASDEDWYRVDVVDGGFDGNPIIVAEIVSAPAGPNYEIAAYYVCNAGGDTSRCTAGGSDNMLGRGCTSAGVASDRVALDTECNTTTDSGALYVRVRAAGWAGVCGGYSANIQVR